MSDTQIPAHAWWKVIIALAGKAAERRACQGSEPGWVRGRSRQALVARHEAAHAITNAVAGRQVRLVTVEPSETYAGLCVSSSDPEPHVSREELTKANHRVSDLRMAVGILWICQDKPTFRSTIKLARLARAQARALVNEGWSLVEALASELEKHGTLEQPEIDAFLKDRLI